MLLTIKFSLLTLLGVVSFSWLELKWCQGLGKKTLRRKGQRETKTVRLVGFQSSYEALEAKLQIGTHQHSTYKIILLAVIIQVLGVVVGTKITMFNSRAVAATLLLREDPMHVRDQAVQRSSENETAKAPPPNQPPWSGVSIKTNAYIFNLLLTKPKLVKVTSFLSILPNLNKNGNMLNNQITTASFQQQGSKNYIHIVT